MIKTSDSNTTSDDMPSTCCSASSALQSPPSRTKSIIKHLILDKKFVQNITSVAFVISMPWIIYSCGAVFEYIFSLSTTEDLPFFLDVLFGFAFSVLIAFFVFLVGWFLEATLISPGAQAIKKIKTSIKEIK